jgi:hypothetical protein
MSSKRAARHAARVQRYFDKSYPVRGTLLANLGFRRCQYEAAEFIGCLGLPLDEGSLLDYGCGDGEFLASVLGARRSTPTRLSVRLEDSTARELSRAKSVVSPLVAHVDAVCNGDASDGPRADVVFAVGVLDYYPDWRIRLSDLAARANVYLVFTMPRRRPAGHLKRRLWLLLHGISISRTTRAELSEVQRTLQGQWRMKEDSATFYCCVGFESYRA